MGRCCDYCAGDSWLPDPETLSVLGKGRKGKSQSAAAARALSSSDSWLYEELKAWRQQTAGPRPVYLVAQNKTLEAIAAVRPANSDALAEIGGIGPSFIAKYANQVLAIIANDDAELAR